MASKETPMITQYNKIKAKYPEELLLYRLGDFYELFYEDAEIGARELNIALTKKKIGFWSDETRQSVTRKAYEYDHNTSKSKSSELWI